MDIPKIIFGEKWCCKTDRLEVKSAKLSRRNKKSGAKLQATLPRFFLLILLLLPAEPIESS